MSLIEATMYIKYTLTKDINNFVTITSFTRSLRLIENYKENDYVKLNIEFIKLVKSFLNAEER